MKETIPQALAGERVDRVVAMLTGLPRTDAAALVDAGAVQLDGRTVTSRSTRVANGGVLEVDVPAAVPRPDLPPDPGVPVDVVHEDDHVVVVDKPPGLVVHPGAGNDTGTLVHGLLARYPEIAGVGDPARPGIVHRLDKGTSGLMLVARDLTAYGALVAQLARREVEREYVALVWGAVEADAGMVDAPVGRAAADPTRMTVTTRGREARTRYEVATRFSRPDAATRLRCTLETGRTHQIRVHLAAIGHPVVGDARYGGVRRAVTVPRPFLHAGRLVFVHPDSGRRIELVSPLPADLEDVLAAFS